MLIIQHHGVERCKRQERVINALRAQDPAYDAAMTFVKVDWDEYGNQEVAVFRNIPRRSTLIVLRGEAELGRVVAGTSENVKVVYLERSVNSGCPYLWTFVSVFERALSSPHCWEGQYSS